MLQRPLCDSDFERILPVVNDWWGGREVAHLLPRLFFAHFQPTSFVLEDDGRIVAFIIGFLSQTHPNEAYIHFVGVHPDYRGRGLAARLYESLFAVVRGFGRDTVRCITSPINQASIAFHEKLGFASSLCADYAGPGQDRVCFVKQLES